MARRVPQLIQVSLTQNTTHNLHTLLVAVEPTMPIRCAGIQIQFDWAAGASRLFLGSVSGDISSARGVELTGGQAWSMSFESNIIMLTDIFIRTDGTPLIAMCTIIVR